jgi:hypothetical protein
LDGEVKLQTRSMKKWTLGSRFAKQHGARKVTTVPSGAERLGAKDTFADLDL